MIQGKEIYINGDGQTSRDFCYVDNVVQINLLAAFTIGEDSVNQVYNVAVGERTSLLQLFEYLKTNLGSLSVDVVHKDPKFRDFRSGDVRHSQASIEKSKEFLGYQPLFTIRDGLNHSLSWYINSIKG
jgi:UDP-N-acetylglucosamine 4-epimerase